MKSTKEIKVSNKTYEQVIGQDKALEIVKKAATQRRNVLLIGDPGTGKCVGKETLIPTELGNLKAKDLYYLLSKDPKKMQIRQDGTYIEPKEEILLFSITKEGKITKSKIKRIYKSNKQKLCLNIKSRSGSELVISGEHPTLSLEKGSFFFKNASLLKEGMIICSTRKLLINNNNIQDNERISFSYKGVNGRSSIKLSMPQKLNKEIAYFLGLFVAEGDYSRGLRISNYNEKIKSTIKKIAIENLNYPQELIEIEREGVVFKKSRSLVYILESYFDQKLWDYEKRKILSKQARFKNIPALIINSNEEIIKSFLTGYIDGDGHFDKEGLEVSSASKELIENLRLILLKLNILSRTTKKLKYASNTKEKKKEIYYFLTITGNENLKKLNENLNLLIDYKKQKLESLILKKSHTNVDLIYGIEEILKEIKDIIKINYNKYNTRNQTINRIIRGERKPSRKYIKRFITNLESDLNFIKLQRNLFTSHLNYINLLELKINNFNTDINKKKEIISKKMFYLYKNNISEPSLNTICSLNEMPNKSIEINRNIAGISELIPKIKSLTIYENGNLLLNNTKKLVNIYKETRNKLNLNIQKLEDLTAKLNLIANSDIFFDTIKEISHVKEEVYDFEVETNHNFVVNGGLIVHNSLLGQALAELLPAEKLVDILSFDNPLDENTPIIKTVPKGEGKEIVTKAKIQALTSFKKQSTFLFVLVIVSMITPWLIRRQYGDIMAAASLIGSMIFLGAFILFLNINRKLKSTSRVPKLLIDNSQIRKSPFLDASGAHAGALLGDCLHDPLQCHSSVVKIITTTKTNNNLLQLQEKQIEEQVHNILKKHKNKLIKQENYLASYLEKEELNVLGEKNNSIEQAEVLSVNKHKNKHKFLIKLITETGKELIVTPEHKVAVKDFFNKIKYIAAENLKPWHKVITLD